MRYFIVPGFCKPIISPNSEASFRSRWTAVRDNRDSGAWVVEDSGKLAIWVGTDTPGMRVVLDKAIETIAKRSSSPCVECRKPYTFFPGPYSGDGLCPGCELLRYPTIQTALPAPPPPTERRQLSIAPPPVGVHIAAAPTPYDGRTDVRAQRCGRCGAVLRVVADDSRLVSPTFPAGTFYPEGALVERGKSWQAISLAAAAPTCAADDEALNHGWTP